jgi:hypothetical protein
MIKNNMRLSLLGLLLPCAFLIGCSDSNSGSGTAAPITEEPTPTLPATISATATDWSAAMGTITLDVVVANLTPSRVRLYPRGIDGDWVETDTSAPFSFTIDISDFPPGDYEMLVVADNDDAAVEKSEMISINGCNGSQAMCGRAYDQVRYVTTHNAMSNAADGWRQPNQKLDVPAQLRAGVHGLMLDLYRAGSKNQFDLVQVPDADPDASFLCHALCSLGKQPLAEGLAEIRSFLDEHPGEVVTLIIESYLSHMLTAEAFDEADLTRYTYVHTGDTWPTLGQMIDDGTRLVVMQDKTADPMYPWLMNVWSHAFETHYSAQTPEDFSCARNRGDASNDLFIFNHFLTGIFGAPELAEQVNYNPLLLDRINECEAFYGTPANFVTVDFVDIGDAVSAVKVLNDMGGF